VSITPRREQNRDAFSEECAAHSTSGEIRNPEDLHGQCNETESNAKYVCAGRLAFRRNLRGKVLNAGEALRYPGSEQVNADGWQ
jgi:hypothetical protein